MYESYIPEDRQACQIKTLHGTGLGEEDSVVN